MADIKDYNVAFKVRNNYLVQAMRRHGIWTAAELSRNVGIGQHLIGKYLNLAEPPMSPRGGWRPSVIKLSEFFRCLPEDLFPKQHIQKALKKNTAEMEMDMSDVQMITDSQLTPEAIMDLSDAEAIFKAALGNLTAREERVLRLKYFEDMTDREIADQLDLTPGRVGQIIKKAHRVLRLKDTKIGDHTTSGALRESLTAFEGARNGRM